jgi:phospholipase C
LPSYGNLIGFLHIALKTELELSGGTEPERAAIMARFKGIKTRGQARAYIDEISAKAEAARTQRTTEKPAFAT